MALVRTVEGQRLMDEAMGSGRGVLLLAPHYGNWEFLSLYLGRYRFTALYDPPRIRDLEKPIVASRGRSGARLLPIGPAGLKALYRTLRQAGVAGLLPDQVPERRAGVYAPFFGRPALTITMAHRLIVRTRPKVLLCAAVRVPGGFGIRFTEADPSIGDADALVSATALNRSIEALIQEDPAQYQWEYKRFKRQPPDRPKLYRDS
jgi:KDO2-lipid IV(A) lauroyltransferase